MNICLCNYLLYSRRFSILLRCIMLGAMNRRRFLSASMAGAYSMAPPPRTTIAIDNGRFRINGQPTYRGRSFQGKPVEGLLLNARMVQGVFDDQNPATRGRWKYPDTGAWDPERNTSEFIAAMPEWRRHGLLSFTINFQGGSPEGYSKEQPWENNAYEPGGELRQPYCNRMRRILARADELGMAPIVGLFYFGQDERLKDEAAVKAAARNAVAWLFSLGHENLLIEVANETNVRYDHAILQPARIHELIEMVKSMKVRSRRFLAGTSYGGGKVPDENVVRASDFLLLHGNGVSNPERIAEMVRQTRAVAGYRNMPILFNEDDHFLFDQPANNFLSALGEYASWGYFDPGKNDYNDGYQSVPVNWGINTDRKRGFFSLLKEVTGS